MLIEELGVAQVTSCQRHPHGECALIAYFLTHNIGDVFYSIGVSKSSCFGCQTYLTAFSLEISSVRLIFAEIILMSDPAVLREH